MICDYCNKESTTPCETEKGAEKCPRYTNVVATGGSTSQQKGMSYPAMRVVKINTSQKQSDTKNN